MKLKDIKNKNGKGLLPDKREIYKPTDEQVGNGAYYQLKEIKGYNKALSEIGEKKLVVDTEILLALRKAHECIVIRAGVRNNEKDAIEDRKEIDKTINLLEKAIAIAKADIFKVKK